MKNYGTIEFDGIVLEVMEWKISQERGKQERGKQEASGTAQVRPIKNMSSITQRSMEWITRAALHDSRWDSEPVNFNLLHSMNLVAFNGTFTDWKIEDSWHVSFTTTEKIKSKPITFDMPWESGSKVDIRLVNAKKSRTALRKPAGYVPEAD